jgi:diaminopimelate decarboxylase
MNSTVLIHDNYGINEKGHFTVSGVDVTDLAKEYGTPLYVLDEDKVRRMCRTYNKALKKHFTSAKALYASKALSFKAIYSVVEEEGMFVDTVSLGEIFTAKAAGYPTEKIFFHGNNKTDQDIESAIRDGVGCFVVDNNEELDAVDEISAKLGTKTTILLRITPGIDPHTNKKIMTGSVDSKFGNAIETGQAEEIVIRALAKKNILLKGLHCHVGSQVFDDTPFSDGAEIMIGFIADIKAKTGYEVEVLNLGGGFGVRYIPEQQDADIEKMIGVMAQKIKYHCEQYHITVPEILVEPGRSIVAAACVTIYTVGTVKTITGYKNYISIDGGMTDNPRYALYESPYYSLIANKANEPMDFCATIAGRCCESGDLIQENVMIQKPVRGDILAVTVTGAYNYSMASNYNRLPRPALVMVNTKDKTKIGIKRETFADLIRNDI